MRIYQWAAVYVSVYLLSKESTYKGYLIWFVPLLFFSIIWEAVTSVEMWLQISTLQMCLHIISGFSAFRSADSP